MIRRHIARSQAKYRLGFREVRIVASGRGGLCMARNVVQISTILYSEVHLIRTTKATYKCGELGNVNGDPNSNQWHKGPCVLLRPQDITNICWAGVAKVAHGMQTKRREHEGSTTADNGIRRLTGPLLRSSLQC